MNNKPKLGDRELDIMQILWDRPGSTIGEVHKALRSHGEEVAYTTIQTMLNRLEVKECVKRKAFENINRYHPRLRESEVVGRAVKRIADRFFRNSTEELIIHLVEKDLEDEQLDRIQKFINKQRQKGKES
ncbi:MAG: BlaI/MecI/CopY family transcriptional regulator [Pyrinomonadaceae bacterium]